MICILCSSPWGGSTWLMQFIWLLWSFAKSDILIAKFWDEVFLRTVRFEANLFLVNIETSIPGLAWLIIGILATTKNWCKDLGCHLISMLGALERPRQSVLKAQELERHFHLPSRNRLATAKQRYVRNDDCLESVFCSGIFFSANIWKGSDFLREQLKKTRPQYLWEWGSLLRGTLHAHPDNKRWRDV